MIPQSTFMVLARIRPSREVELRQLLASMNDAPGRVNPKNSLVPFARFESLHYARFLILDDRTVDDNRAYDLTPPAYPLYLAFLGDVDGEGSAFIAEIASAAKPGLRAIFSCCETFERDTDLVGWMRSHSAAPAAKYVNWLGRTTTQSHEEAALYESLTQCVRQNYVRLHSLQPREVHAAMRAHAQAEIAAGRLTLTSEPPTPLGWQIRNFVHLVGVPLLLLLASPVLIPVAVIVLLRLRALERTDPELCWPVDQTRADALSALEDHQPTNQFTAMGSLKPGLARLWMARTAFFLIDFAARHVFTHGGLARVRTIHFARWVFLDGSKRAVFFSNYDGSLESYMDDFINKVGFGLNVAFSAGIGYPRTRWLLLGGSSDERKFKEYLRRHQVPTQVWFNACSGLTAVDLERNGRVRAGVEQRSMSDREALDWVSLL
jgi:hypothetical protein